MLKKLKGSRDYISAIQDARQKISQLKINKDTAGKELQQLQLENLSGATNETEISDCRARLGDLGEKLSALAAHEKGLKSELIDILKSEKGLRQTEIFAAIKSLKQQEREFTLVIVESWGRLCACQNYQHGEFQNPSFPAEFRDVFYDSMQQTEKELGISGKKSLKSQINALQAEGQVLGKDEINLEALLSAS
jgi:hypothetical protein